MNKANKKDGTIGSSVLFIPVASHVSQVFANSTICPQNTLKFIVTIAFIRVTVDIPTRLKVSLRINFYSLCYVQERWKFTCEIAFLVMGCSSLGFFPCYYRLYFIWLHCSLYFYEHGTLKFTSEMVFLAITCSYTKAPFLVRCPVFISVTLCSLYFYEHELWILTSGIAVLAMGWTPNSLCNISPIPRPK